MTSLFDLPFEEPEPEGETRPPHERGRDVRPRAEQAPGQVARPSAPPRAARPDDEWLGDDGPTYGEPPPRPARLTPYTVSGLTAAIRNTLETGFGVVLVEGEVSNCRTWNTGHVYFTLKDDQAQIRCVLFRTTARQLRFTLGDGQHVLVRGRLGVYESKGEYQIVCDRLEPRGKGELQLAFEQLKQKLAAEGLFDEQRKRPLPALVRRIGIVTSIDGAALHDIITVLRARFPAAHLIVRPTRVQGDGAAGDLARAIRIIARVAALDVLVVGRGGGSAEDLWAFNEEVVARAIAACPVPVISAVGHEVDFTIADFVADRRAPTPSAAAALVAQLHQDACGLLERHRHRLDAAIRRRVLVERSRVQTLSARHGLAGWPARIALRGRHVAELEHALRQGMQRRIGLEHRRIDVITRRLEAQDLRRRVAVARHRIASATSHLDSAFARRQHVRRTQLGDLAARLNSLSPLAVLGRGYSLCWDADRSVLLRDARAVNTGDRIRVVLARGSLNATVTGSDA